MSALYTTSPPTLKFTLTLLVRLSDVNVRSLSISTFLPDCISRIAEAVDVISNPLTEVAVAAPSVGVVNVGLVKVLFVRT